MSAAPLQFLLMTFAGWDVECDGTHHTRSACPVRVHFCLAGNINSKYSLLEATSRLHPGCTLPLLGGSCPSAAVPAALTPLPTASAASASSQRSKS